MSDREPGRERDATRFDVDDGHAFVAAVGASLERLLRTIRSPAEADEIRSETIARLWVRRQELRDHRALGAYARKTAERLVVERRRMSARTPLLDERVRALATRPTIGDVAANLERDELLSRVTSAVRASAVRAREGALFRLAFVRGLAAPEIASELGVTAAQVHRRKHRMLERVRAAIEGASDGVPAGVLQAGESEK